MGGQNNETRVRNSQEVTFNTTVADLGVLCVEMREGGSLESMERTNLLCALLSQWC